MDDNWDDFGGSSVKSEMGRILNLVDPRLNLVNRIPWIANPGFHFQNEPICLSTGLWFYDSDVIRFSIVFSKGRTVIAVHANIIRPRQLKRDILFGTAFDKTHAI